MRLFLFLLLMLFSCLNADQQSKENDYYVGRLFLSPVFLPQNAAVSLSAEGGPKTYRFNGTIGYIPCECHRFKFGGEYLGEKLKFEFDKRKVHHWSQQYAVGGKYEYLFCEGCWLNSIDISGYYSQSYGDWLKPFKDKHEARFKRLDGARNYNVEAGISAETWNCGSLLCSVDYDHTIFERHLHRDKSNPKRRHHHNKSIESAGYSIEWDQPLLCGFSLGAKYQYKRIYDFYEGNLNWSKCVDCGDIMIGVYGYHVKGKKGLPSNTTIGFELGFGLLVDHLAALRDACTPLCNELYCCDSSDLAAWVADPAVYMPEVLVIGEEETCLGPELKKKIPDHSFPSGKFKIDVAKFFKNPSKQPLRFTFKGLPRKSKIHHETGVISGTGSGLYHVTVKVKDDCGERKAKFNLTLGKPPG